MTTSKDIRQRLVNALRLDLIGPDNGTLLERETLPQLPSRWYLTGFLVPLSAEDKQRVDETMLEGMETVDDRSGSEDEQPPESAAAKRAYLPSSMGMSLLIGPDCAGASVRVAWGDYEPGTEPPEAVAREDEEGYGAEALAEVPEIYGQEGTTRKTRTYWTRIPRTVDLEVRFAKATERPEEYDLPGSGGLKLAVSVRPVRMHTPGLLPEGARSVSVFLVNRRRPASYEFADAAFAFQAGFAVRVETPLVPRPNLRGLESKDWDEKVADLQYRDAYEYAVGHGVATEIILEKQGLTPASDPQGNQGLTPASPQGGRDGSVPASPAFPEATGTVPSHSARLGQSPSAVPEPGTVPSHSVRLGQSLFPQCYEARTCWIPEAEVERVAPASIDGVELSMEALSLLPDGAAAAAALSPLADQYRAWIAAQRAVLPETPQGRRETGTELLNRAESVADRIASGIALLNTPEILEAFRTANRVMAVAARQRFGVMRGQDPASVDAPRWRPFQLAFILMNLDGIATPDHLERGIVDLLFFPTGGGKTEAYLGLAAFTLVLRRLRNPGLGAAGVSVLMRYTLRLLTLDQLGRAATLICALELERQKDPETLGPWPFEIGLWVGRGATPNRMGKKGDGNSESARAKTIAYKNDDRKPSPIPLEECPWCGTKFSRNSFQLVPNADEPTDLRVVCGNRNCAFTRDRALPILAVDEPMYRRLPCFMIATVDKFAAMPWTGEVGLFFGGADRYDPHGFYGPCTPGRGNRLERPLLPPDLVIQDELHLISGPLGTMVGLYETALDALCLRGEVRPKIVASTATVRRAQHQIQALFCRNVVEVFPPPGPDRRDSYFARTHSVAESNGRLYVGIAAQGRSPKVVQLRAYMALLGAAQQAYKEAGGHKNKTNPADPYMTLLGYFNSLRELGGSRRIIEDEVSTRLTGYARRKRVGEKRGLFDDRRIAYEVLELTSRVSTNKVANAKRKLALPFHDDDRVDVAIATNMISVGLDIVRLGLMVVLGQPKTSAEYIQATSRVGRDPERPGLVVTLLNIHRARDRSHYERFRAYHASFYRSVEATSVTPFSPRALDRGLAGAAVGLARLGHPPMTRPEGAAAITRERGRLEFVVNALARRAAAHAPLSTKDGEELRQTVRHRAGDLLDTWEQIANEYEKDGVKLQYQREIGGAQRLLYDFLDPDLKTLPPRMKKFCANRSLRDVEAEVNLWLKTLDEGDVELEGEEG